MFSIIIPTYNRSKALVRALDSLIKQNYKTFEVIVADDGSSDDTQDVIKNFEDKLNLKYVWNPNWGGPARPRNIAANLAKNDWLCFLDADDFYYPEKLSILRSYLIEADYDVLAHSLDIVGEGFEKKGVATAKEISNTDPFSDLLTNGNKFPNSGTVVRKAVFEKINGYREDKRLIAVEDFDLLIRLSRVTNRFKAINQSLGAYYLGPDQISGNWQKYIDANIAVFSDYQRFLDYQSLEESKALENYIIGSLYFKAGNKSKAKEYFIKTLKGKNLARRIKVIIRILQTCF